MQKLAVRALTWWLEGQYSYYRGGARGIAGADTLLCFSYSGYDILQVTVPCFVSLFELDYGYDTCAIQYSFQYYIKRYNL